MVSGTKGRPPHLAGQAHLSLPPIWAPLFMLRPDHQPSPAMSLPAASPVPQDRTRQASPEPGLDWPKPHNHDGSREARGAVLRSAQGGDPVARESGSPTLYQPNQTAGSDCHAGA